MIYQTTLTERGQITIPKPVREFLGMKPGERVFIDLEKKKKQIKIESFPTIFELAGKFKPKKKIKDVVEIREYMEKHYKRV